jgi:hypothetical protein
MVSVVLPLILPPPPPSTSHSGGISAKKGQDRAGTGTGMRVCGSGRRRQRPRVWRSGAASWRTGAAQRCNCQSLLRHVCSDPAVPRRQQADGPHLSRAPLCCRCRALCSPPLSACSRVGKLARQSAAGVQCCCRASCRPPAVRSQTDGSQAGGRAGRWAGRQTRHPLYPV